MPPEPIHDVLNAVLRIFGNYDGKFLFKCLFIVLYLLTINYTLIIYFCFLIKILIIKASWNSMKKFLSQKGIIESILDFDPRIIDIDIRQDLNKFISEHSSSFEKKVIYKASLAAGPLADWVTAIL